MHLSFAAFPSPLASLFQGCVYNATHLRTVPATMLEGHSRAKDYVWRPVEINNQVKIFGILEANVTLEDSSYARCARDNRTNVVGPGECRAEQVEHGVSAATYCLCAWS